MPVVYSSPDLLPNLSVVYVCVCGLRTAEYGTRAGEPPSGWVRVSEGEYLCAHCAAVAGRKAVAPSP
jgi:hypothetical protein